MCSATLMDKIIKILGNREESSCYSHLVVSIRNKDEIQDRDPPPTRTQTYRSGLSAFQGRTQGQCDYVSEKARKAWRRSYAGWDGFRSVAIRSIPSRRSPRDSRMKGLLLFDGSRPHLTTGFLNSIRCIVRRIPTVGFRISLYTYTIIRLTIQKEGYGI